ncbi:MAG: serine--tRNA ligase [Tepidisphaeraceae bacterium]|jgi:seryl-tRNA synthetase
MIDLKDLRDNPDKYRRGAQLKNVTVDIDAILQKDKDRVAAQQEFEKFRAEQNVASKEIGRLKDPAEKQAAIARVGHLKISVKSAEERTKALDAELELMALRVPQPPDADVPVGKDAADNIVLYKHGEPRKFSFKPKSHIELGEKLHLLDFGRGVSIAGSRSYFLVGVGAEMQSAVLRMAMDMMLYENGFTQLSVPVMVRHEAMRGTGFFPAGREQAYRVGEISETGEDERFLTGTAEVSVTAFHIGEVLDESDLPRKYTAVSTCFRREAGTYGKDTAGLYRVHQFEKCEQVVLCRNDVDESKRWHETMRKYSETLLQRLGLPYRVIQCCTGDIGVKNASMQDIETWMPSREEPGKPDSGYGETHSASRLYEFQARRLNLRYKGADGKLRFCHTLNNTVVASPRILIPIWENYQNEDGSIAVPEVLRPYMNGRERVG